MIYFTRHASEKLETLKRHQVFISREQVMETVNNPETIDESRWPLFIAQRTIDSEHVLRVVYKKEAGFIKIITFYPGRRKQYAK